MRTHVVAQGEYLTQLAHRWGFDAESVWNDPANAALKATRSNADILLPGDVLHLPEPEDRDAGCALRLGGTNHFVAEVPELPVTLTLLDAEGHPLAKTAYAVHGLGERVEGTTDENGRLSVAVPVTIRTLHVVVEGSRALRLAVGDMDPIESDPGIRKRLEHLGFYIPRETTGDGGEDEGDAGLRDGVFAFQKREGLAATGVLDAPTRDAILAAHGS